MTIPKRQNVSPRAVELIRRIYRHSCAGCCWHIVLDDNNWDSIEFCRQWALDSARAAAEYPCETLGACQELAMLDVTPSVLKRAMAIVENEIRTKEQQ
jgi:hypothetical protein